jgi:hypothetical protein
MMLESTGKILIGIRGTCEYVWLRLWTFWSAYYTVILRSLV